MEAHTLDAIKTFCLKTLGKKEWTERGQLVLEVQRFVESYLARTKADRPIRHIRDYLKTLQRYCDFTGKTPTRLIDEVEHDENLPKRKQTNPAAIEIADFARHLQSEGGLSHNSIVIALSHVKRFYRANKFTIHDTIALSRKKFPEKTRMTQALASQALQAAESNKVRGLVHFLWSSGLSISDACALKRTDIVRVGNWGVVALHRQKTGSYLMTVVTPDCMDTLQRWFDQSKKETRILGYEPAAAQQALRRLARDMGKWSEDDEKGPLHAHNFRHGFINQLKNQARVDSELVEFMVGHDIGTAAAYMEITPEQLVERIKPFYDFLCLTGTANHRVGELEERVEELTERTRQLERILREDYGKLVKKPKPVRTAKKKRS